MAAELGEQLEAMLEKLKLKRERLIAKMKEDEQTEASMGARSSALVERLNKVTTRMNHRITAKREYEKTIMETEGSYSKIVDSSTALLGMLKHYVEDDDEDVDGLINNEDVDVGGQMDMVDDKGNLNTDAVKDDAAKTA